MAAGPGGRPVGRVSVRVVPDTSGFAAALEAYLQRLERRLKVEIPVGLNERTVALTEARLALLTRDRRIAIDVDTRGIDNIGSAMGRIGGGGGFFRLLMNPAVIGVAVGAIGAAVTALPGLLSAIAAPIGAIVVGFEGIKRAAEGLALPFQVMQTTVSNVFEKAFLPGMRELVKIFPTLTEGFNTMGVALGKMFSSMVAALTSPQGLSMIGQIFDNIGRALTILAPAMGPFVDTFLRLAVEGTAAFARFAPLIASIITGFNSFIAMLERMGLLGPIMDGIGISIVVLLGAFAALVGMSALIVGGIGLIIGGFVRLGVSIGTLVGNIIGFVASVPGRITGALASLPGILGTAFRNAWNAAKTAVTTKAGEIVAWVKGLPRKIADGIKSLPGLLKTAAKNAWDAFWNEIKRIGADIISWVTGWAGDVASAAAKALAIFSPSKVFMGLGKNTMEGFRIGIERAGPDALAAVTDAMTAVAGIRAPNVTASILDEVTVGSSVADMRLQAKFNAEALIGGTFRMDGQGNLQLIAAGG